MNSYEKQISEIVNDKPIPSFIYPSDIAFDLDLETSKVIATVKKLVKKGLIKEIQVEAYGSSIGSIYIKLGGI